MNIINEFKGEYNFLSNFYPCKMIVGSYFYASNEHFFQAYKMTDKVHHEYVRNAETAGKAKKMARSLPRRGDWDLIKDSVMYFGLKVKFLDQELKEKLLATGDAILVEGNTWGDTYWGFCKGVGQNKLGQLLIQVRMELR